MDRRASSIVRVLAITLVLNVAVAACKIAVGLIAGSLTVLADGFHSLLDASNNVVGLTAIYLSARPPDEDHPYGHRKFEHVAAMVIGALVMFLCWEVIEGVFHSVRGALRGEGAAIDHPVRADAIFIAAVGLTLAVNLFVSWYERREGERLSSSLLRADSMHTLSDSVVTIMGLLSLLLAHVAWWVDPLLASGVAVFLLRAAWSILQDNIATMTDRSRLDPEQVRVVAEAVSGVENAHAIRSHGMENDIHLDLHIVVDRTLTAGDVAEIERAVDAALRRAFPALTMVSIHHQTEAPGEQTALWRDA
ncbi:MAG: cation transporter [Candidatus Sumerlaeia bacterium]|nr:cation transporter [Candidatus Sumerlaeia bacterium]